jgi:putative endonuclease
MVYAQHFETITDAVSAERQVKGWSRAKKEAMIRGEWDRLPELAKRRNRSVRHEEPT